MDKNVERVEISWSREDIERRFYFDGAKYTQANSLLTFLIAGLISVLFYGLLIPLKDTEFADMFRNQGAIPYAIVFFSAWSLAILFIKFRKLALQKRCLNFQIVPNETDFTLTPANVDIVTDRIFEIVDQPKKFVLFNRIMVALANLRNLGQVGDVDEILRSQAESDESILDTSYSLISGFIWAIPVLGFIGTVLGLSTAIGNFGAVLKKPDDGSESVGIEAIKGQLFEVTGGLSMAFVTTLEALVAALFIQLLLTFLKKAEHEFLDDCSAYCTDQVVNKLRIVPFERTNVG